MSRKDDVESEGALAFPTTHVHRGLGNEIGENNCFLNVTIQALWHLGPFRTELRTFIAAIGEREIQDTHINGGLLDAICHTFIQYEFTEQSVLPPNQLRESLAKLSGQYELGKIADANEAFDAILHRIHSEQSASCPHKRKCLSHKVFGGLVMEQTICAACRSTSEPTLRSDFILCFQALELISEAKNLATQRQNKPSISPEESKRKSINVLSRILHVGRTNNRSSENMKRTSSSGGNSSAVVDVELSSVAFTKHDFGQLLQKCMQVAPHSCPGNDETRYNKDNKPVFCSGKGKVCFYSLEPPLALALSVGWSAANEDTQTLSDFYSLISYHLSLSDLFNVDGVTNDENHTGPSYTFRGLICYYGLHYVSIFQEMDCSISTDTHKNNFLLFDDKNIRSLGDWEAVGAECVKSRYQPVLLLYELNKSSAYIIDNLENSHGGGSGDENDETAIILEEVYQYEQAQQQLEQQNLQAEEKQSLDDLKLRMTEDTPPAVTDGPFSTTQAEMSIDNFTKSFVGGGGIAATFGDTYLLSKKHNSAAPASATLLPRNNTSSSSSSSSSRTGEAKSGDSDGPQSASQQSKSVVLSDRYNGCKSTGSSYADNNYFAKNYSGDKSVSGSGGGSGSGVKATVMPSDYKAAIFQNNFQVYSSSNNQSTVSGAGSYGNINSNSNKVHYPDLSTFASESKSFKARASEALSAPKTINRWSFKFMRYNIALDWETVNGRRTLGIKLQQDHLNHVIVAGFYRGENTEMLPAERSGKIQLKDRILAINGCMVDGPDCLDTVKMILAGTFVRVVLDMESSTRFNLWFQCPHCSISNLVDEGTEKRLKQHNNHRLLDSGRRDPNWSRIMLKCHVCKLQSAADETIL